MRGLTPKFRFGVCENCGNLSSASDIAVGDRGPYCVHCGGDVIEEEGAMDEWRQEHNQPSRKRSSVTRPYIEKRRLGHPVALHDESFDDEFYDSISELTLKQAANALMNSKDALLIFNHAEWNQDGASRYTITDNSSDPDHDPGDETDFHMESYVIRPGIARTFVSEDVPISWEVRDQHMRDAYKYAFLKLDQQLTENEKNPIILSVYYIAEYQDFVDSRSNPMREVVGLKPVKVRFYTPHPGHGYMAARRFNAIIDAAVTKLRATWLDGLYFKVGEGGILGLNDKEDFNYVAEMMDFEGQSDSIEMLFVDLEELMSQIDTSKVKPDITEKERRVEELETMFESYLRQHPDAPRDYMTISIIMGLSDEYYALLEEFGEL